MADLHFTNDLLEALDELNAIDNQLNTLSDRKIELRSQVQKWLTLNEIELFEVKDNTSQIWKINITSQSRRSIGDWAILEQVLGEENKHLIVEKTSSVFTVKKSKKFSEEWLTR
jgi:hypothetical protein